MARFDAAGTFQWVRTIIGPGDEHVRGLCLGPRGTCFIAGEHAVGATFDGSSPGRARPGVFVASFDALGTRTWSDTAFWATLGLFVWNIGVDRAGACYLSGWTTGSASFGGIPLTIPTNFSAKRPFVAKYSPPIHRNGFGAAPPPAPAATVRARCCRAASWSIRAVAT